MVELADRTAEAVWKIENLEDYDRRLERAARDVDELAGRRTAAALIIYEAVLVKSGKPLEEVRGLVDKFREQFEDDEEELTIPRVSGLMNTEGDEWFFGDEDLRIMTGRLLGQFQHRVAQYNYVDEKEVLRRWADAHDTRLFIRRRIHETEPVVGVVSGFGLPLVQYLRVAAGGNTVPLTRGVSRSLSALGFGETEDLYEIMARAEGLALRLGIPAPIVGRMLEDISEEGLTDFPEPPPAASPAEEDAGEEMPPAEEVEGDSAKSPDEAPQPSGEDREARKVAREDPGKGEEPSRVQDPQAKDAPGVEEEAGTRRPTPPRTGGEDAPENSTRK